jgi:hypothetical protein
MRIQFADWLRTKSWVAGALAMLLGSVFPSHAETVTSDVFRASVMVQGVIQFNTFTNLTIHPVQMVGADLVNLALGRELGTTLLANEVLAYAASPATNSSRLFVYDSNTGSNLATIGEIGPLVEAKQTGVPHPQTEMIAQLDVPGAGTISNGLTGANLILDGRSILDTNGAVLKFNATMLGVLDTVFVASITNLSVTNDFVFKNKTIHTNSVIVTNVFIGVTNMPVVIHAATVNTSGRKIGTLVEGP